ncbi:dTDP-4-dehydrorhamnose 3,5-epimerase [Billgrantia azerbaijanica]|nr:dTDP-4-dehydrorhamnose 3,5-epimerase [Halomonas azerbaijanica]
MIFRATTLQDAWLIEPEPRGDERGWFARTMCRDELESYNLTGDFVQQNASCSLYRGTLRGFHFQRPPHAEAKLIRCLRGSILDVIIDLREGSPSHLRHEAFELSDANRRQIYVPPGFAHAFLTLCDDVEVSYLVSARYTPEAEDGLRFDDPALGIDWPIPIEVISEKDATWALINHRDRPLLASTRW